MTDGHADDASLAALMPPDAPPPARRSRRAWLLLPAWLVAGGIVGAHLGSIAAQFDLRNMVVLAVLLVLFVWTHLLVHEAGHVLAGLSRGMRLFAAGIGPFRVERTVAGWRMRRTRGIAGIGGFAAMVAAPGRPPRRRDQAIYLLGGVTGNLVAAAAALPIALSTHWSMVFAWLFVGVGVFYAVLNLLPFRSGGWRTDGLNLLALWRNPREAVLHRQIQAIVGSALAGARPRDWPADELPTVEPTDDPVLRRSALLLRLSWALDAGERDVAAAIAPQIVAAYGDAPDGVRQNLAIMMATYAAQQLRSECLLAAWLPRSEGTLFGLDAQRHWLRAELAALHADTAAAADESALARAAVRHVHDEGSRRQLLEYLNALDARLAADRLSSHVEAAPAGTA